MPERIPVSKLLHCRINHSDNLITSVIIKCNFLVRNKHG
jgi:hypothetical protein